jgi:hypothetical protein
MMQGIPILEIDKYEYPDDKIPDTMQMKSKRLKLFYLQVRIQLFYVNRYI